MTAPVRVPTPLPPIDDLVARISHKQLTAGELVERCLAAIQRYESQLHAWVMIDETGSRQRAMELDRLMASGKLAGPLHGIPVGIKDIFDVAHWPTQAGSPLRRSHVAASDAPVVARLRAAGAILLGKTVTTQFASFDPPPTRNPWNLAHTPGGSSSGSAAAVAASMCPAALGSQTGGSITRPAAYCGVAGFKPTFGAISTEGVVPLAVSLDHVGVIARCAADLALLWNVIRDQTASPVGSVSLPATPLRPYRIGVLRPFFFDSARVSREVISRTESSLAALASRGAILEEIDGLPSSFGDVTRLHRRIMAVEAAAYHREHFPRQRDQYGKNIASLMDEGLVATPQEYQEALAHQRVFREELARQLPDCGAFLTPSTNTTAPGVSTTGDPLLISPWSYCGWPTVSLPCGLGDSGLPCGVQLIARPGQDDRLLQIARWTEEAFGWPASFPSGLADA